MVGVAGLPAADQAGLLRDEPDMITIVDAPRFRQGEDGFVDRDRVFGLYRFWLPPSWAGARGSCASQDSRFGDRVFRLRAGLLCGRPFRQSGIPRGKFGFERSLDSDAIIVRECTLLFERPVRPKRCVFT